MALLLKDFQIVLLDSNPNLFKDLFFASPMAATISTSVAMAMTAVLVIAMTEGKTAIFIITVVLFTAELGF